MHYLIDENGMEDTINLIDSIVINRDTILNNQRYFILEGVDHIAHGNTWQIIELLRDSSSYLVNEKGDILMSSSEFGSVLNTFVVHEPDGDKLLQIDYQMIDHPDPVELVLGEFDVINYQGRLESFKDQPGIENPRYIDKFFAEGLGPVLETYYYYSNPNKFERRLINYNIEE